MGNDTWNRRQLRKLIERVGRLERTQDTDREIANGPEDWHLEDGALYIYDDDGNLRTRVGKQTDGTYTSRDFRGPIPAQPSQPELRKRVNGLVAIWDGTFEDEDEATPGDFHYIAVHASHTAGFSPSFETKRATIVSEDGGQAFIALPADGDWHVAFVTVTTSGKESVKSLEATGAPEATWLKGYDDSFTMTGPGPVTVTLSFLPVERTEHLYWNGVYQKGSTWSRNGQKITVADSSGRMKAGDVLTVEYLYSVGDPTAPAWVPDWTFAITNACTTANSGLDGGQGSGTGPLNDGSMGTSATFYGSYNGNTEPQFFGSLSQPLAVTVAAIPTDMPVTVEAWARVTLSGVGGLPPRLGLDHPGTTPPVGAALPIASPATEPPTADGGWLCFRLWTSATRAGNATFNAFVAAPQEHVIKMLPHSYSSPSVPTGHQGNTVGEIVIYAVEG